MKQEGALKHFSSQEAKGIQASLCETKSLFMLARARVLGG
ncbi:hypothetical protein BN1086_03585 [Citrobacter koseri]|uniref:Uncharacterized protein n=1 Tax=Citrobacter koseri TaxID=545 RepID=A0A078LJ99_CITKO|nr:hypothetical protein BN1086_03585 [Citrobacter koseri]